MTTQLDYRNYETLSDYWKDARGRVPLAMMHGIRTFQEKYNIDFQTAYGFLLEKGIIIEVK